MRPRALASTIAALLALGACHRAVPSVPADPMLDAIRAEEREAGLSYAEGQGKQVFARYCATCHGDEGKGDGQNASNLDPAPPDLTASRNVTDGVYLRRVIAEGSAAVGRSPLSPPWGRTLTAQQIEYVVLYCRALGARKP
jgi:mono/diheme cytochrome c family protein